MNIPARLFAPVVVFLGVSHPATLVAADASVSESPFSTYATLEGPKAASLLRYGRPVPVVRESTRFQEGDLVGERSQLKSGDALLGWQTSISSSTPDAAYRLERFQFSGNTDDLELVFPLDASMHPVTWEFSNDSGNAQCDILLYDGALVPGVLEEVYGVNKIPKDIVKIPNGTPVLRVRVLFAAPGANTIKDFHPVIQTDASGRRLVIPVPAAESDLRVLFYPERYRETAVTAINSLDFAKSTLRFAGVDDHYQFAPEGALAVKRESEEGAATILAAGLTYREEPEPTGRLIAFCDFETLENDETPVLEANLQASVADGRLVDAGVLSGKALYLGQRRLKSTGKLTIPAALRESFSQDQITVSFWIRQPWGQLGKHKLVFWPYRRGAEGLKEPFTVNWSIGQFGPFNARFNRWDASDDLILEGFARKLNVKTSLQLTPPGWNHVALSVREAVAKVYLNGELKSDVTMPGPVTLESLQKGGALELFKGLWGTIDKVRIHDFALSQNQIAGLMREDLPDTLLHYPLEKVVDGFSPATPSGEFPVDAWSWDQRDFKPEETFAARAHGARATAGEPAGALRPGPEGIVVPPKALADLGIQQVAVSFWFRSDKPSGTLVTSNNHPKYGFTFKFQPKKIHGVLCGNYQVPEAPAECAPGEWHHFAFCYDNRRLRMFLDGQQIRDATFIPGNNLALRSGLVVGPGMEGEVADLRVLSRMIDVADVEALMKLRDPKSAPAQ